MKYFAFIIGCVISIQVFAGDTEGKVNLVYIHAYNDYVLFSLTSTQPGYASCAASKRYAISTSTQQGKNVLSTILAAKAANLTITVGGKNTCSLHGDAEDINAVIIH